MPQTAQTLLLSVSMVGMSFAVSGMLLFALSTFPRAVPLPSSTVTRIQVTETAERSALGDQKLDALFDFHKDGTVTFAPTARSVVMDRCLCVAGIPLISLEGAPQVLRDGVSLAETRIATLKGLPREIQGNLILRNIPTLVTFEGIPERIAGDLLVGSAYEISEGSTRISSPMGMPKEVTGSIDLSGLPITSLVGLTPRIGGSLKLYRTHIQSLQGLPSTISGSLDIGHTPVADLSTLPKRIGKNLYLYGVPATRIPSDIEIGCAVILDPRSQPLLAQSARESGYRVGNNLGEANVPGSCLERS